jgi:hypothetical protein
MTLIVTWLAATHPVRVPAQSRPSLTFSVWNGALPNSINVLLLRAAALTDDCALIVDPLGNDCASQSVGPTSALSEADTAASVLRNDTALRTGPCLMDDRGAGGCWITGVAMGSADLG